MTCTNYIHIATSLQCTSTCLIVTIMLWYCTPVSTLPIHKVQVLICQYTCSQLLYLFGCRGTIAIFEWYSRHSSSIVFKSERTGTNIDDSTVINKRLFQHRNVVQMHGGVSYETFDVHLYSKDGCGLLQLMVGVANDEH